MVIGLLIPRNSVEEGESCPEGRATARRLVQRQRTTMCFDHAFADRQAKASAFADTFGGEKRFKNARGDLGRNTRAIVHHFDHRHTLSHIQPRSYGKAPLSRLRLKRMLGIDDQVDQQLNDLVFIGFDGGKGRIKILLQLDISRAQSISRHIERAFNQFIDLHDVSAGTGLPRHGKEGFDNPRTAIGRVAQFLNGIDMRCACQLIFQDRGTSKNNGERVVKLVRDTSEQLTKRGQFFRLMECLLRGCNLFGRFFLCRLIEDHTTDINHFTLCITDWKATDGQVK